MYRPVECKDHPGFYKIPGMDHHVINARGVIMNTKTGHCLAQNKNASGYMWSSMRGESLHCIRIHRAVALAMLEHPDDVSDLVVNHIDGNKLNNSPENLEWCTHQYNCEHAGENGLTVKCSPIQVRDYKTGAITEFPSIMACSKFYDCQYNEIAMGLKYGLNGARVWQSGRQYRRRTVEDWPDPIMNDDVPRKKTESFVLRKDASTFGRSVEVDMHDLKTDKYVHFDKISDVASFFNVSLTGAWAWLCKNDQPIIFGRYHLKLKRDPEWKTPGDLILEDASVRGYIPIQVYNPETGETRVFETSRKCSAAMGVRVGALFERLKHGPDHIAPDGWIYCRYPMFEESVPFEKMET